MKRIEVAVLTMTERAGWTNPELDHFIASMHRDSRFESSYEPVKDYPSPDFARNEIVKSFLKRSAQWLLMIDNDIRPRYLDQAVNLLELASFERPIVSAPVPIYRRPKLYFNVFQKTPDGKGYQTVPYDRIQAAGPSRLVQVDVAGSGVLAIHRDVLARVEFPWFFIPRNPDGSKVISEDFYFCEKASAAGCPIWTSFNHQCGHYNTVDLMDLYTLFTPNPENYL